MQSNLVGFLHITEGCRNSDGKHFVDASSSSVYGINARQPLSPLYRVDHPISLHAACKRSNELTAHSYPHLFELASTGFRYFTVYGPWGRPDMTPMLSAKAILAGEPTKIFNKGKMARSSSYTDDVATASFKILNIESGHSIEFMRFIELFELNLGLEAKKILTDAG